MNHQTWNRVAVRVIALMFVIAGAAACDRHREGSPQVNAGADATGLPASADASARTLNVPPAPPTGDPPGTTAVDPEGYGTSKTSKQAEQTGPHEGDNHSYSSVAPNNPQKAQGVDAQQTKDRTDLNPTEGKPK